MDYGLSKHALKAGQSYVKDNLDSKKFAFLRAYFDINGAFVKDKLFFMFWPFNNTFDFLMKPELYIPIMSMIFVVIIKSLNLGFNGEYHPEKMFLLQTRAFAVLFGLATVYKGISVCLGLNLSFMSLVCLNGYKHTYLLVSKTLFMFGLRKIATIVSLLLSAIYFLFLSRSLQFENSKGAPSMGSNFFLLALAVLDTFVLLIYMKF